MRDDCNGKLARFYDEMDVAILIIDAQTGKVLHANRRVFLDLGLSEEQVLGRPYQKVFWKEFHPVYENLARACEDGETHTDIFDWTSHKIWEQISARRIEWNAGQMAIFMTVTNITEVTQSLYEYRRMAYNDPLLHLPNRLSLKKDIDSIPLFEGVGVVRFDICHLSSINDMYGWEAGDILLRRVRDWLFDISTTGTKVYRIFEVGFGLLIQDTTPEELDSRAAQIKNRFQQPWPLTINDEEVPAYLGANVATIWGDDITHEIQNLLFHTLGDPVSDSTGPIRYNMNSLEPLKDQKQLRQQLISCIRRDMEGFSVYYQPIADVETGRWVGVEALCRWNAPGVGMVSPAVFIKEAEQMGLIETIDNWVCKTALKECRDIGLQKEEFHLDLNVSPSRKLDHSVVHRLFSFIKEIGFPEEKVTIEITESTELEFDDEICGIIRTLKEHGVSLALDDFGTGYSSFANLLNVSANVIKTDRSMVEDITSDSNKQFLMRMLVSLAEYGKMGFIVEGVETEEQKELLWSLGVKRIQGYYYSKPLPLDMLRKNVYRFA